MEGSGPDGVSLYGLNLLIFGEVLCACFVCIIALPSTHSRLSHLQPHVDDCLPNDADDFQQIKTVLGFRQLLPAERVKYLKRVPEKAGVAA